MAKVILEFVGDDTGLKPVEAAFDRIEKEQKEVQTAIGITAQKIKEIPKALAGKEITDFGKGLQTASERTKDLVNQLTKLKAAGKGNTDEFKNLAKELKAIDFNKQFTGFTAGLVDAAKKATTLKGELRALKEQLSGIGDEGSPEFQRLSIEAAKLEDKISDVNQRIRVMASDTFAFDAMVDGIRGLTAAFTIAQGAAGLFGEENEDI